METKSHNDHETEYAVNDESETTTEKVLTPTQIMSNAGIDPATNYLIELIGNTQKSFQGNPGAEIHLHPKMRFITSFTGPTPVA
jgi:hypothetical protein